MKKIFALIVITSILLLATACNNNDEKVFTIGATPVPHVELLEEIKEAFEDEGYTLKIVEFTDYVTPNLALENGEIDANFFQHLPYLDDFNVSNETSLVSAFGVHVEPLALYSKKFDNLDALKDGATISIPADPVNGARALLLLQSNGFITIDETAGLKATENDILENPNNLSFIALEASQLPRTLDDVDAAIINGNFAIDAGLNPLNDGLLIEGKDSPYVNIVAVKEGDEDLASIKLLKELLQSSDIKAFIESKYEGAVVIGY